MNIKKFVAIGTAVVAVSALALDYVEVTGVKARQRYPWNGLVDIDFTLDSKATEPYLMNVVAYDNVGKTNLPVRSVFTENISYSNNPCMVSKDATRIVWDASADLPNGFKCSNVLVSCQDVRAAGITNLYMVIDLANGATASSYPVSYMSAPPAGGWTEEYKLTKLVLRRVEPGSFNMGSSSSDSDHAANETLHKVTLTKPFYIGIYELTAQQYALITGGTGADTKPVSLKWYEIRGFDTTAECTTNSWYSEGYSSNSQKAQITQKKVMSEFAWPETTSVDGSSLLGKLRARTGIQFDLPSEAQWEYACRAHTTTAVNNGGDNSADNKAVVSGDAQYDSSGDHLVYVGNYMPNAYGLYDMAGSLAEWCLDGYVENLGESDVVDPQNGVTQFKECYWAMKCVASHDGNGNVLPMISPWCLYPKWLSTYSTTYGTTDSSWLGYTGYASCRVVRGGNARSATRSYQTSLNTSGSIFNIKWTSKVSAYYSSSSQPTVGTRVFDYTNQSAGVRLVVGVDE